MNDICKIMNCFKEVSKKNNDQPSVIDTTLQIEKWINSPNECSTNSENSFPTIRRKSLITKTLSIGENFTYIVSCLVLNDDDQVLMIQEAKSSCRGKWYLPAGRVEKNETFFKAAQRECLEESGLEFLPISLLQVKSGISWYRFAFIGKVIGGNLKTLKNSDDESLQAKFLKVNEFNSPLAKYPLRSKDILELITLAFEYKKLNSKMNVLPSLKSHSSPIIRTIIFTKDDNDIAFLWCNSNGSLQLPIIDINDYGLTVSIDFIFQLACEKEHFKWKNLGVLAVEHKPFNKHNDGFCVTALFQSMDTYKLKSKGNFKWIKFTNENVIDKILNAMSKNVSLVELSE